MQIVLQEVTMHEWLKQAQLQRRAAPRLMTTSQWHHQLQDKLHLQSIKQLQRPPVEHLLLTQQGSTASDIGSASGSAKVAGRVTAVPAGIAAACGSAAGGVRAAVAAGCATAGSLATGRLAVTAGGAAQGEKQSLQTASGAPGSFWQAGVCTLH